MRRWLVGMLILFALLAVLGGQAALPQEADQPAETEEGAPAEEADGSADEEAVPPQTFWGSVKDQLLATGAGEELTVLERIVWGIVLVALGWAFYRIVSAGLGRIERRMKRIVAAVTPVESRQQQHLATVLDFFRNTARYTIIVLTIILLLDRVLEVNVIPILTGAGVVGIAVAFGSQSLVRDVVTGVFQLLEGQYAVGDYVQIGTAFGKVEHIGLRITRLRDLQDKLYFIPNGTITMVTTYDEPSTDYILQAPFVADQNEPEALEAIEQLATDLRAEYPELVAHIDEPQVVTSEGGACVVKMRLSILPTQDWIVTDEVPARVKQLFASREIAAPEGRAPKCYLDVSPLARMPKREAKKT